MTTKIAVSLPDHLVAAARAAVADGRADSVSGYVAAALEDAGRRSRLREVLDDLDAEFGAPDAATMQWAADALQP